MLFDFRGCARFIWRWLSLPGWTLKRVGTVLAFLLLFPLLELLIWSGLALDRLLWPAHRRQAVVAPVFVIGNFRSGSTFLHRILARDSQRFSSMAMWEILFAPAISLRQLMWGFARAERAIGRPVGRLIDWIQAQWESRVVVHEVRLDQPEEDDYLGLHIWSVLVAGMSSGVLAEARPYLHFDQRIAPRRQTQVMAYYRRCLQRHLHAHGGGQTYLAKNPALTPKLQAVMQEFPDARFIQIVRDPIETVPSFVSMMRWAWSTIDTPCPPEQLIEFALDMARHWYLYPLHCLAELPPERFAIVNYHALRRDPAATLQQLYQTMQWGRPEPAWLEAETANAQAFQSAHRYDWASLGLERAAFDAAFAEVYASFDFAPDAWGVRGGKTVQAATVT